MVVLPTWNWLATTYFAGKDLCLPAAFPIIWLTGRCCIEDVYEVMGCLVALVPHLVPNLYHGLLFKHWSYGTETRQPILCLWWISFIIFLQSTVMDPQRGEEVLGERKGLINHKHNSKLNMVLLPKIFQTWCTNKKMQSYSKLDKNPNKILKYDKVNIIKWLEDSS